MFSSAERKYPIYFRFPWAEKDEVEIQLPEGFTFDKLDVPSGVSDTSEIGKDNIQFSYPNDKKTLFYNRNFHFGKGGKILFPVQSYPALKSLFEAFHKADTHSIVLRQEAPAAK
jgi:hypothetical protein